MLKEWVFEPQISPYELLLFNNAVSRHKDSYGYWPIAMAKREETGIKYRFLCIAQSLSPLAPPSHFACIEVYKSEKGMPYVTRIHKSSFDQFFN
jgi:hypothetical protein